MLTSLRERNLIIVYTKCTCKCCAADRLSSAVMGRN